MTTASTAVPAPPNVSGYLRIAEHRYRETLGFTFDEFRVGDVFEHRPGRTVTEMDNVLMSMLSMNPSPLHIDAAYCSQTRWAQPIVSSLVTLSIVSGLSVRSTSGQAVANLGWEMIRLHHPVFVGDTLYAASEVLSKRISKSQPGNGIVRVRTSGHTAPGVLVISFERSFMVPAFVDPAAGQPPAAGPAD